MEKVLLDPNTHTEYTDIARAQQAALQVDSRMSASDLAAIGNKRRHADRRTAYDDGLSDSLQINVECSLLSLCNVCYSASPF